MQWWSDFGTQTPQREQCFERGGLISELRNAAGLTDLPPGKKVLIKVLFVLQALRLGVEARDHPRACEKSQKIARDRRENHDVAQHDVDPADFFKKRNDDGRQVEDVASREKKAVENGRKRVVREEKVVFHPVENSPDPRSEEPLDAAGDPVKEETTEGRKLRVRGVVRAAEHEQEDDENRGCNEQKCSEFHL